jgi:hypothetical protein
VPSVRFSRIAYSVRGLTQTSALSPASTLSKMLHRHSWFTAYGVERVSLRIRSLALLLNTSKTSLCTPSCRKLCARIGISLALGPISARHPEAGHAQRACGSKPIHGIGELYAYDTSLRICAKLNLFPTRYIFTRARGSGRAPSGWMAARRRSEYRPCQGNSAHWRHTRWKMFGASSRMN